MADVEANIRLVTTGGSESASEVMKADTAIRSLTSASSGMEGQFQHRFQHIGLMLFAGDALRASGLGAETRIVISGLNTALTGAAAAAGIGSGGILLLVTALVALAGITAKVIGHHKDLVDQLNKVHEAHEKQIEVVDKNIKSVYDYISAGGDAGKSDRAWLSANETLRAALIKVQIVTDEQTIAALKLTIAEEETKNKTISHAQAIQVLVASILAQVHATGLADKLLQSVSGSINDQNVALLKNKAALAGAIEELERLRNGETRTRDEIVQDEKTKEEAARGYQEMRLKHAEKYWAAVSTNEHAQAEDIMKLQKAIAEDKKKQSEKQIELDKKWAESAKQNFDKVEGYFGSAVAKMFVEGKSFTDSMTEAFRQMEEAVIEMIIKMIAEYMLFEALTGMGSGAMAGRMFPAFAGAHATGGSVLADRPTMAMFGEAGPEMATFTPLGSSPDAGGAGGGSTQININVTANGVSDPDELARLVGPALIKEIRGMGQLNYTRG